MRTLLTTLHSKYVHASLALPCLAAYCGEQCGELLIREFTVHEPKESLLAQISACAADVVAFSVYLWNRTLTLELVHCLKQIDPELKIVLGGPEISFEKEDFFARVPADALICGEGERPMRHLLQAWLRGMEPEPLPGLRTPQHPAENGQSLLASLDQLPSPFAAGRVDLSRGLVYYESSRGCPYSCSFCMSALDEQVRSFSLPRIFADLKLLMEQEVPQIKFVDRTFNYDSARTRDIIRFILQQNRSSHFHFEIGAHLLDEASLQLLETVPPGMFQFEIGVQSTLPETLQQIGRQVSLERLAGNVRRLQRTGNILLHLDLIAGLPGDDYPQLLQAIDWTAALRPDHLQLELVKLLPGSPLRRQAAERGLRYDPAPPYTVLETAGFSYLQLEKLRGMGRLYDLLINSRRFSFLMPVLQGQFASLSTLLEDLDNYWRERQLYSGSRPLRDLYLLLDEYLQLRFTAEPRARLRENLARDYAHHERASSGTAPDFFDTRLTVQEQEQVRDEVRQAAARMPREGKLQYFAAVFSCLPEAPGRQVLIFLYLTRTAEGRQVVELRLPN